MNSLLCFLFLALWLPPPTVNEPPPRTDQTNAGLIEPYEPGPFSLKSPAFKDGDPLPLTSSRAGGNMSPPLAIGGLPERTQSMALIVTDGDAANGPVIHWIVWNIPPQTQTIAAGTTPAGAVVGINDFGNRGYDGPAPPSGVHHYRFHLYALNGMLSLPTDTKREDLLAAFENHTLSDVNLMGTFAAP